MKGKTISRITAGILSVVCTTGGILSPQTVEMFSDTVLHVEGDSQPSDYYDIYGSILNQTAYVDAMDMTGTICDYALCDYDSDGIQECIALVDLGAGQVGLFYQLYDYQNGQVIKVDEIGGGYESLNEWYLAKDGNGIVIVGYQIPTYFYHLWTANGVTLLDAIDDGEIEQYEQLHTQYCGASISFYSASDIGKLKSIAFQDSTGISALPTSGKCGENAEWSLDEATGTLTISGSGAIYDYGLWAYEENAAPWFSQSDPSGMNIRHIVIQEGITRIGECSFFGTAVTSVMLPESLQAIGGLAFHDCTSLKEITIPKSVSEIGSDALGLYGNGDPVIIEGFTVYGYAASAAQQYVVEQNSYPFVQGEMTFVALDAEEFEEVTDAPDDWEEIPTIDDLYDWYFIEQHLTNHFKENELWYSSYGEASNSNPLKKTVVLADFDGKAGALRASYNLDFEKNFFDLDFTALTDNPFDPKDYYFTILSRYIYETYDEEQIVLSAGYELAALLEEYYRNNNTAIGEINSYIESYGLINDSISTLPDFISEILQVKTVMELDEYTDIAGKILAAMDVAVTIEQEANAVFMDVQQYIKYTVLYRAFLKSNKEVQEAFKLIRDNTKDSDLVSILDNYIGILDTDDTNTYLSKLVFQYINERIEEGIGNVKGKIYGEMLNYLIEKVGSKSGNEYVKIVTVVWQTARFVVSVEDFLVDNLMEPDKYYTYYASLVACSTLHKALYDSYTNQISLFQSEQTLDNAKIIHTINTFYMITDTMAIENAKNYLSYFAKNNLMVHNLSLGLWVHDILGFEVKELIKNPFKTFYEIQNVIASLDTLEETYAFTDCCFAKEYWMVHIATEQYSSNLHSGQATDLTKDTIMNWYKNKISVQDKWYSNSVDLIVIGCPVTVNVYDAENQLIAHLGDDDSEVDTVYQQFFFTFAETNDEWEEGKTDYSIESTRAKMLILPHDTTEYRYEILGDSNGEMDILSYYVEDYFNSNWFDSNCINFSFEDVEVTNTSSFVIEKNDKTYSLLNQPRANNTSEIVLSTETTSDSPKSMLILWIVIAGTIMGVGAYFYQKRSKNR